MSTRALATLLCTAAACAPVKAGGDPADTGDTGQDPASTDGDHAYDISRLLEVEIELDPDDWAAMRIQDRNLLDILAGDECLEDPFESPYTWFVGTATIDGQVFEQVEVRKKGLVGSVVSDRPSLKLDLNDYLPDQRFDGLKRLTLNNGRQDGSRLKTCLGYGLYADAGLPASRCSYAHVVVNGEDLGVYANVEPVKAPYLDRNFGNSEGNLYEGTLSDFRDGWTGTFDDKTDISDFSDVQSVVDALASGDDAVLDALEDVVDVDQFIDAWAMEVLIGHWDSYSGNANNFYVYNDPTDDRFRFLPWGIDAILTGDEPFGAGQPVSIVGATALPSRLGNLDASRQRYFDAQDWLLDDVWDEDVLEARLDAAVALTEDAAWPNGDDDGAHRDTISDIRDFIENRRGKINYERDFGDTRVSEDLRTNPCLVDYGDVSLSFETTWGSYGTLPTFSTGSGSWLIEIQDVNYEAEFLGAVVGEAEGYTILFVSGQFADGSNVGVYGFVEGTDRFDEAGSLELWGDMTTYLMYDGDGDYQDWQIWAYLGGSMDLSSSGTTYGSAVNAQLATTIYAGSGD